MKTKKIISMIVAITLLFVSPFSNSTYAQSIDMQTVEDSETGENNEMEVTDPAEIQDPAVTTTVDVLPEGVTEEVSGEISSSEVFSEESSEAFSEESSEVSSEVSAETFEEDYEYASFEAEASTEVNTFMTVVMDAVSGEGAEEDAPAGETITVYRGGTFTFGDKAYHWYGTSENPDSLTANVYPVCGYDFADASASFVKTEITDTTMRKAVYYAYGADGYWNGEAALEEYFIENNMTEEERAGMSYLMISGFAENVYHLSRQTTGAERVMEIISTLPAPASSFRVYALDDAATENACDMVLFLIEKMPENDVKSREIDVKKHSKNARKSC